MKDSKRRDGKKKKEKRKKKKRSSVGGSGKGRKKIIQKLGKGEISNKLVMINKCVTQQVTA